MAISERNVFRPQKKSGFGIAQRLFFRKYPKSAQTSDNDKTHTPNTGIHTDV